MSQETKCPKCGSTNVHISKKGASFGKAIGGAVVAGPVGALAGLHGSGDIEITCLSCGNRWNPVQQRKQDDQKRMVEATIRARAWKNRLIEHYENGDFGRAEGIASAERGYMLNQQGLEAVYKSVKSDILSDNIIRYVSLGILVSIFVFMIIRCSS